MPRAVEMVEVQIQEPRGVAIYLYAGTFADAKAWGRDFAGERPVRFRSCKWKPPEASAYSQRKGTGREVQFLEVSGPVAFKWIANGVL
jgi:hypothetical protein